MQGVENRMGSLKQACIAACFYLQHSASLTPFLRGFFMLDGKASIRVVGQLHYLS